MSIRVGVVGAVGRMGATVCRAVSEAAGLELVAAIDPAAAGRSLGECVDLATDTVVVADGLDAARTNGVEVLVDFTSAKVARRTLDFGARHGIHVVCGTTGLSDHELDELRAVYAADDRPNAIVAPNFAISAVLMMRLAELVAPYFDNAEIIELHHDLKRDAPSGTALESARRIALRRETSSAGDFGGDPTEREVIAGARGARGPANINLHSIRLRGLVAHQEIIFGALGQSLTIRQDSYDRSSFMPGVLLGIAKVAETPGLTLGLDRLLDL